MRIACTIASFALATGLLTAPLVGNEAEHQQAQPRISDDALYVYSAGIDALLVDPKDAGLLRALKMLDQRIIELPNELGDPNMPAPAMQLVMQLLMGPMSLRAGLMEMNDEPMMGPPFYAQMSFHGSAEGAANYAGRFKGMIAEMGAPPAEPAPGMPGMQMVDADGVPLYFGTMRSGDGSAFVLGLNRVDAANVTVETALPAGVRPAAAFMFDARKIQPVMDMMMGMGGPEMEMLRPQLEMTGLVGPNAMQIIAAIGHGADRTHGWARFTNYRKVLEASGMSPTSMLTAADLRRIPADATYAQISKVNLSGMLGMMRTAFAQGMQAGMGAGDDVDPYQFVEDAFGIHPQRDLFDHLGQTMGMYMSDTTGGGGLTSTVCFIEVTNPEALNATMARMRGTINQIAQTQARGYVRVGETTIAGQKVMTLQFPGLPVPLEACWAIADGWLYAAASPNALAAAINAGKGTGDGLNGNARFRAMGGADLTGAMQVTFVDTPRMMANGYGALSMGMSALANAVRSPTDPQRDAGLIMPSFNELSKDAKATVSMMRLTGDDLVMTTQGDRSMLVNAAGAAGAIGGPMGMAMIAGALGGVTMPAMSRAQRGLMFGAQGQADELFAATRLRMLAQACHAYSVDHNDRLPRTLQDLLAPGFIDEQSLSSPFGPAPDDHGDYWFNTSLGRLSDVQHPDRTILAYDRAMFFMHDNVVVAFVDGHVQTMDIEEFRELTRNEHHKGIDFKLPY